MNSEESEHSSVELRKGMCLRAQPKVPRVLPRLLNEVAVGEFGRQRRIMRPRFMEQADAIGYAFLQVNLLYSFTPGEAAVQNLPPTPFYTLAPSTMGGPVHSPYNKGPLGE